MSDSAPALFNPPTLSATELHEILLTTHAAGNGSRRRFIDCLRALEESRLYLQLGFPSLAAYTDATFHYGRSQAYSFVRVSRALDDLPQLDQAFERGEISFSLLSRLTQVAVRDTEAQWLEHCRKHPLAAIDLEVRDAIKKQRKHPRKDTYGLPGLPVKVSFEFSPEEHAVLVAAIKKTTQEMSAGLDGAKPDPKAALLYLSHRILETNPAQGVTADRTQRAKSPFAVIFRRCPDCLRAAVETGAGPFANSWQSQACRSRRHHRFVVSKPWAPRQRTQCCEATRETAGAAPIRIAGGSLRAAGKSIT